MRRLRKLLSLSHRERSLLILTIGLMTGIRLGLRLLSFQTLLKLLNVLESFHRTEYAPLHVPIQSPIQSPIQDPVSLVTPSSCPSPRVPLAVSTIVWVVDVSSRFMPGGVLCLARALTTQVLMHWAGYQSELRIGVMKGEAGTLEAHAWVEYQGQVVIGNLQELSRFIPLPSVEKAALLNGDINFF